MTADCCTPTIRPWDVWDEYAVLVHEASTAAVEVAFARTLQSDIHMSAASFAALVAQEAPTPAPATRTAAMQVQL